MIRNRQLDKKCSNQVKINGQKLAKSPFSFPEKVRELNIIGKLDFP